MHTHTGSECVELLMLSSYAKSHNRSRQRIKLPPTNHLHMSPLHLIRTAKPIESKIKPVQPAVKERAMP